MKRVWLLVTGRHWSTGENKEKRVLREWEKEREKEKSERKEEGMAVITSLHSLSLKNHESDDLVLF